MKRYKIEVRALLEFEIESEDKYSVNGDACAYVENNRDEFDWCFDTIEEIKE